MPATKKAPARKAPTTATPRKTTRADGGGAAAGALQQALKDLDRLRDVSGDDVRRQVDSAVKRIRDVADDLRERSEERTATVEQAVGRVADQAWLQLGTLAIRGLRDADALTELSTEIRKRKAELRRPAGKPASAS